MAQTLLDQLEARLKKAGVNYQRSGSTVSAGSLSATMVEDPDGRISLRVESGGKPMGYRSLSHAARMLGAPLEE